jgi:hypothetical protein
LQRSAQGLQSVRNAYGHSVAWVTSFDVGMKQVLWALDDRFVLPRLCEGNLDSK